MRTLRLPLVATLVLALLGWVGAGVVAQDEDPDTYAASEVTGTMVDVPKFPPSDSSDMGTYIALRGDQLWSAEWDDARLPETLRLQWVGHEYRIPGTTKLPKVHVGTMSGDTEDGAWSGSFQHTMGTDFLRNFDATLEGAGAYEGLTAIISGNWTGFSGWDVDGIIIADMPDVAETSTE